eukprot:6587433-Lingulodinium_polyedra.AAC.1
MDNCVRNGSDASPWFITHGEEFQGELIPFGARVTFHPNVSQGASYSKFDAPGVAGIFAGYELKDGYRWNRNYL